MLHSINYCMCVFLKFICIYFFLYYRGPCVRKLFTGLIMYYPLKIKNIVLCCIVLHIDHFRGHPDVESAVALWLTRSHFELVCNVLSRFEIFYFFKLW